MKGILKKCTAVMAAAAIAMSAVPAFAEGSRDLTGYDSNGTYERYQGYRPYLEWRDRIQYGMESENVIYVYAEANETVQLASGVMRSSDFAIASIVERVDAGKTEQYTYEGKPGTPEYKRTDSAPGVKIPNAVKGASIAVTLPKEGSTTEAVDPTKFENVNESVFVDGESNIADADADRSKIYMFRPSTNRGYIATAAQEAGGPGTENDKNHYLPIEFTAPITGTYAVRFLSSDYGTYDTPSRKVTPVKGVKYAGSAASSSSASAVASLAEVEDNKVTETTHWKIDDTWGKRGDLPTPTYTPDGGKLIVKASSSQFKLKDDEVIGGYSRYLQTPEQPGSDTDYYIKFTPAKSGTVTIKYVREYDYDIDINVKQKDVVQTDNVDRSSNDAVKSTKEMSVIADSPVFIYMTANGKLEKKTRIRIYEIIYTADGVTETPTPEPTSTPTPTPDPILPNQLKGLKYVSETKTWLPIHFTAETHTETEVLGDAKDFAVLAETDESKNIRVETEKIHLNGGGRFSGTGTDVNMSCAVAFVPEYDGVVEVDVSFGKSNGDNQPRTLVVTQNTNPYDNTAAVQEGVLKTTEKLFVRGGEPVYIFSANSGLDLKRIAYTKIDTVNIPMSDFGAFDARRGDSVTVKSSNGQEITVSGRGNEGTSIKGMTDNHADGADNIRYNGGGDDNKVTYTPSVSGRIRAKARTGDKVVIRQCGTSTTTQLSYQEGGEYSEWVYVTAGKSVDIYVNSGGWSFYGIEFMPTEENVVASPPGSCTAKTVDQWIDNDATVPAWDVRVAGKTGRVWSDILFLNLGNHSKGTYAKPYILTEDGFLYQMDFNGMQPYSFLFYSNNRGFLLDQYSRFSNPNLTTGKQSTDSLQPLEHSFYSALNSNNSEVGDAPVRTDLDSKGNPIIFNGNAMKTTILANYKPVDSTKDKTHRIFFNVPDATALRAYTGKPTLKGASENGLNTKADGEALEKILESITYEGSGNASGTDISVPYNNGNGVDHITTNCGTEGVGGKFKLVIDDNNWNKIIATHSMGAKTLSVKLDFSDYALDENKEPVLTDIGEYKGIWQKNSSASENEKNNIVTLSTVLTGAGTYTLTWDGKDAYGNAVPYGGYKNALSCFLDMGTAHFPLLDVERNPNGVKLKMLNEVGETSDRDRVYYNNEATSPKTDPDEPSAWYFTGQANDEYPSKIADGLNKLAGVSSNFGSTGNGVMAYKDTDGETLGDYTALDMWTKYQIQQQAKLREFGVLAIKSTSPYVSFVATNGTVPEGAVNYKETVKVKDEDGKDTEQTAQYTPFDHSHVAYQKGRLGDGRFDNNQGKADIFGNTISTGYLTSFKNVGGTNDYIRWKITIPAGNANIDGIGRHYGDTYVKMADTEIATQAEVDEAEYLTYELYSQLLEENEFEAGITDVGEDYVGIADDAGMSGEPGAAETGSDEASEANEPMFVIEDVVYGDSAASMQAGDTKSLKGWRINVEQDPVLNDNSNEDINPGKIYKVNHFGMTGTQSGQLSEDTTWIKLNIKQKLPFTLTAAGADVIVGLVIDNLYAPSSAASVSLETDSAEVFWDCISDNNGSVKIGAKSIADFETQYNDGEGQGKLNPNAN